MTIRAALEAILRNEDLNFLLTNRIPRRMATRFMGWFSAIEQPVIRDLSLAVWRRFADLNLHEAEKQRFDSLRDCFTRALKPGARPIDPDPTMLTSPCDAIVGASGRVDGDTVLQAKGFPYKLTELLGPSALADQYRDGTYVTLRLTASMYHRFHAFHDCTVEEVTYFSGDTWNVNPIALARVEKLFCRNERAAIRTRLSAGGHVVTLVPVAAVLVASIRLRCLAEPLRLASRGANMFACDEHYAKGEEMGWFEHGSTIIVFAPQGFSLCESVGQHSIIRMGQPLMRLP
jgi:phosphatidylserine decarboxylase